MNGARTLWNGFADEVESTLEKTAGPMDFMRRAISSVGRRPAAASSGASKTVKLDDARISKLIREANESRPTANDRLWDVVEPPAGPKPPPTLDDLGAMNRWISESVSAKERDLGAELQRLGKMPGKQEIYEQAASRFGASRPVRPTRVMTWKDSLEPVESSAGPMKIFKTSSARVTWDGFAAELDKLAGRSYFLPDGRQVDLDVLEPLLAGRSVDTATEEEIQQAMIKPGLGQRMGTWMRQRLPFLFDEE